MKTKKILYNILSSLAFQVIAFACGLILPQLVLETYGSAYNGVIQTITQFVGYISILTIGVNGPTRVAIYNAFAQEDDHKLHGVVRANELYMRKIAVVLALYMVLLAIFYPLLVRENFGWWEVASLVLIIGTGELVGYVWGYSSQILLEADQRNYIYTLLLIFSKISSTVLAIVLINRSCTIYAVRIAMAVSFAVAPILTDVITKRMYHINTKVKPDNSAIDQRGDAVAHSLAAIVNDNAPTFLLAILTDPVTVSVYSIYDLILDNLLKVQSAFTDNLEGAFGEFWAKKEIEKFRQKFSTLEYLMFMFLLLVYTTTATLILPFMKIYTADVTDANYVLPAFACLFVCSTATYSLRTPYTIAVQAAGKYRETKKNATTEAIINVGVSLVATCLWGLKGVVIGSLAANLYRIFSYAHFYYCKMLNTSMATFYKRIGWMLISGGAILWVQRMVVNSALTIESWLQWAVAGVVCVAVAGVLSLCSSWFFCRQDLKESLHLVKVMLSRR